MIRVTVDVEADLAEVWNAWTTEEGIKTFLGPACAVELRPNGRYEIYFDPSAHQVNKGERATGLWLSSCIRCSPSLGTRPRVYRR